MSKSFKKNPYTGNTTATSEKKDKRIANRKLRRKLNSIEIDEDTIIPELKEVSDVWLMDKDGKSKFTDPKFYRK